MSGQDWQILLLIVAAAFFIWIGMRMIKSFPGLFSKANFSKTITTTGVLALIIIIVVGLCVILLRGG